MPGVGGPAWLLSWLAAMKTSLRRLIGSALLGCALGTPVVLTWSGAVRGRELESHTYTVGNTTTTVVYESHWPHSLTFVLGVAALCGLLLLLLPSRARTSG